MEGNIEGDNKKVAAPRNPGRANLGHDTLGHRELGHLGTWATWELGPLGTWATGIEINTGYSCDLAAAGRRRGQFFLLLDLGPGQRLVKWG